MLSVHPDESMGKGDPMIARSLAACAMRTALGASLLMAASCSHEEWSKERIVVSVDTPGGTVTGESVVAFKVKETHAFPDGAMSIPQMMGEATVVPLPDGRKLFVLLENPVDSNWACCAPAWDFSRKDGDMAYFKPDHYGLAVIFDDIRDPKTLHVLDPGSTFGNGYRISEIYTSPTDEAVTKDVDAAIPWIRSFASKDGNLQNNGPQMFMSKGPDAVRYASFIRGM